MPEDVSREKMVRLTAEISAKTYSTEPRWLNRHKVYMALLELF